MYHYVVFKKIIGLHIVWQPSILIALHMFAFPEPHWATYRQVWKPSTPIPFMHFLYPIGLLIQIGNLPSPPPFTYSRISGTTLGFLLQSLATFHPYQPVQVHAFPVLNWASYSPTLATFHPHPNIHVL